jgi:hypothetical protein
MLGLGLHYLRVDPTCDVPISPMVTDRGETGAITFSFRLSVGTVLRQLSPKPTMYFSQQMQIGRFKDDFCSFR